MNQYLNLSIAFLVMIFLHGCSMQQLTVRASMPLIEGGVTAMNRESDLQLAKASIPANLGLIEGMIINDPKNKKLQIYAAQAYYGFAYGFVEDQDRHRAAALYYRGLLHGQQVLQQLGISEQLLQGTLEDLQNAVNKLDHDATAALFWSASCWAKWIDMKRDSTESLAQLPKAVMLMQRVFELDENFYMAGPHLFFGAYYANRSPMLGGNYELAAMHFDKAGQFNHHKLLLVDLLRAQYLDRQLFDQQAFHTRLVNIREAADDIYPQQMLINLIAKQKASLLLSKEEQWF